MGWGNIITRRLKVFAIAIIIYVDYKAVQKRVQWANGSKKKTLWEKTHERNAKRVLNLMIELEGLWVKLGQYLSTRADVLPEAYISVLRQLQDSLPPRSLKEVRKTIERELGKSMKDLFSGFVNAPLATASIAQVHRATMQDGREVVVKVQHDGVKEIILEDLKNAKSIVDWIAWAEPQYDFNPMIDEWCREAPKELDFNHEAENTRTVARNLSQANSSDPNFVHVLIPEIIQSTEKVLIMEYMDGIRLNDRDSLEAYGVDKQRLVEEITRAYAHQIYIDGFFNGDPHPGNFLVSKVPPHCPILLDFGLTKSISSSMKQALAKMFLACAEGDHVALLAAFSQMGLKLRVDMPEQSLEIAKIFFRNSTPANEAAENIKALQDQRERNMKALREKTKLNEKEAKRFNPVDAFPGDAIIFARVLNLLRGLSSTLNVRIVYLEIMRPFAESTLGTMIKHGPATSSQWIHNSPVNSDVENKLRKLLLDIGTDKILGIQVCAYKDGKVIIDTAAGVLGKYDPRPVEPDSLFPVFSVTKGITAGLIHWLVDKRKLRFDERIANIWPNFGKNKKELIQVNHVLNHTAGLQNAMGDVMKDNPLLMCNWEESLNRITEYAPETEPGIFQFYHYLSFGWLCGGIIEHASGKKLQEVLEEAIIYPLNIQGEMYIGIPPGIESRLATLTVDMNDINNAMQQRLNSNIPANISKDDLAQIIAGIPVMFNMLNIRRAIIPAANGHCSARALARYYAAIGVAGQIPLPHSSHSKPPLGSHTHIPKSLPIKVPKKKKKGRTSVNIITGDTEHDSNKEYYTLVSNDNNVTNQHDHEDSDDCVNKKVNKIFDNLKLHDAIMGVGDFSGLVHPDGKFGLGFRRYKNLEGNLMTTFGHSGLGGSTGFCDVKNNFAMAVMVNKMSLGGVTRSLVQLVCDDLGIPLPDEFSSSGEKGPDMQLTLGPS